MRQRLLALLIVCLTMLTQVGAPMAGVASTGSGSVAVGVWCKAQALLAKRWTHARSDQTVASQDATKKNFAHDPASEDLPVSHQDHASCGFCGVSVDATPVGWIAPEARVVEIYQRLSFTHASESIAAFSLNRSAPARGPPDFI